MMMTRTLALLAAAMLATARADRVVVLGSASQVHPVSDASVKAFTPTGLAELAIGAFGLPTGETEAANARDAVTAPVESPVVHDLFHPVQAYAQIFLAASDAAVLNDVQVPKQADFHKAYTLESGDVDAVPAAVATQLSKDGGAKIACVGSSAICNHAALPHEDVHVDAIDDVLKANAYLKEDVAADMTLAQELAQTQQLTKSLAAKTASRGYFVVSFSEADALDQDKQEPARQAITKAVQDLIAALETAYPGQAGVQLVAATPAAAVSRMLMAEGSVGGSLAGSTAGAAVPTANTTTVVNASSTNSTSTISATDIEEYQIILWTSVLLAAALAVIIMAMCNMDSNRDSLLYAKFTANTNRKFD